MALYALLRDARPSALAGDRLTVAMPSNFALTRAREPGNDDILASAFAETLGHRLQPEFVLAEADAAASGGAGASRRSPRSTSPRRSTSRSSCSTPRSSTSRDRTPQGAQPSEGDAPAMNPQYQKMMKQVQEMQRKMAEAQEELANETVEASAGGGMVTVVMSGSLEVREVRIQPEAVDPDDVEMLQDLVMAATNEAPARRPGPRAAQAGRRHRRPRPAQHPRHVLSPRRRPPLAGTVSSGYATAYRTVLHRFLRHSP